MQAVLLAGGKGTRLRPFAASFPKPLVPLGDKPVLEILIRQLREAGFDRIVLAVGHLASLVEAYFQDGASLGVSIRYHREVEPLGTAGPLAAIPDLDEHFLVLNGDLLTDMDFRRLHARHRDSGALLTVGRYRVEHRVDLGVIRTDADGFLTAYDEKPVIPYEVSMGAYAMSREVVERWLEPGQRRDMPDLLLSIIGAEQRVATMLHEGFWLDIGRPDDYARAQDMFERNPRLFLDPPSKPVSGTGPA